MGIEIHLTPARVEQIVFTGQSHLEEDFDHAAWLVIRPLVERIDRRLRRVLENFLETPAPKATRARRRQ